MIKNINTNPLQIPSIDAKDLYISNHQIGEKKESMKGYSLLRKTDNGLEPNLKKYINTYDFSLDLIELRNYVATNGKHFGIGKKTFSFYDKHNPNKEYSNMVINVTFNYSVKEFNRIQVDTYMKFGYELSKMQFSNCICKNKLTGEIIGVQTNQWIDKKYLCDNLPLQFSYKEKIHKETSRHIIMYILKTSANKTIVDVASLRNILYKDGFKCDGRNYVRFKRSSGSSRVGKCLFIEKNLSKHMQKWGLCGLEVKDGQEIDLAALEAYIALPTSSIIDVIEIDPKSILIIDDYESVFNDTVIETTIGDDGWLHTDEKTIEIHNSIWDGQSLIDKSVMGEYSCYGMLLLRNKFFKSCCFNTNIQKWFRDNDITRVSQLNGFTLATDVSEIKMITTPNSVKYLKFGSVEQWLNNLPSMFGVVKHEKKTHFFDGQMVQCHYQLLNTLQLSKNDVEEFLQPSFDYMNKLNTDIDVFKYHIKCQALQEDDLKSMNDIVYTMLNICPDFKNTKMFMRFKRNLLLAYRKNLKKGHVLVDGNYSVLFGNSLEMLQASIGIFDSTQLSLNPGEIYNTRFPNEQELLCCRSPHVTIGNILISKNIYVDDIKKYFNLTDEIVCLNSINDNILERLSGCDFDSDQMLITNNKILLNAAKKNYTVFKVPTSNVHARKVKRTYTSGDKADLDIRTSNNLIGEIINLSQQLNSQLWDVANNTKITIQELYDSNKDFRELYFDICQLDVMSCIEIDKAKKEFDVDSKAEIKRIQNKHVGIDKESGLKKQAYFLGIISKIKGYDSKKNVVYEQIDTTMDYLEEIIEKFSPARQAKNIILLSDLFKPDDFDKEKVNKKQIDLILDKLSNLLVIHKQIMKLDTYTYSYETKTKLLLQEKNKIYRKLQKYKITQHTMYRLLQYIDKDKIKEKKYLFEYLFFYSDLILACQNKYKNIKKIQLQRKTKSRFSDCNCDVLLYGMEFTKTFW